MAVIQQITLAPEDNPLSATESNPLEGMLPQGVALTRCGLTLPDTLDETAWTEVGRQLGRVQQAVQWCIGDWWAFGEGHRYGSRKQLVEADDWSGPNFHTCVVAGSVCRAFESVRRRTLLSFSHHTEVMALTKRQQDKLLAWCEETIAETNKPRSTRALREEIQRRHKPKPKKVVAAAPAAITVDREAEDIVVEEVATAAPTVVAFPEQVAPTVDAAALDTEEALTLIGEALKEFQSRILPHSAMRRTMANALAALGVLRKALQSTTLCP